MDNLKTEAVTLLKQLIAIPSFSGSEQGTALLLQTFFRTKGVPSFRVENNVWVRNRHYDAAKPSVLLNSHHDTVKPDKGYTNDPFHPVVRDGKLYGLGSNDAGGPLVSLIAAFLYFYEQEGMKYNLLLGASAEEETSGKGGLEALLPSLGEIDCAVVGEPTGMEMALAEKGLLVLDCIAHGVAGHAARAEGENAILKAMRDIQWFSAYRFPEESELLGPVKMTVSVIEGGIQHNMIPAECRFTVDIRVNDRYTHEEILEVVKAHTSCTVIPRSTRLRSTSIAADHPLVKAGAALGKKGFGSATLSDKALMPFPALKIGPGDSARSHTADEYIYIEEIHKGIETYISLLQKVLL